MLFQFYYRRYSYLSGKDLRHFKGREGEIPNVKWASCRKADQAQFRSPLSPLVPGGDSFSLWGTWLEDRSTVRASALLVHQDHLCGCQVSERLRKGGEIPSQWSLSHLLQIQSLFLTYRRHCSR